MNGERWTVLCVVSLSVCLSVWWCCVVLTFCHGEVSFVDVVEVALSVVLLIAGMFRWPFEGSVCVLLPSYGMIHRTVKQHLGMTLRVGPRVSTRERGRGIRRAGGGRDGRGGEGGRGQVTRGGRGRRWWKRRVGGDGEERKEEGHTEGPVTALTALGQGGGGREGKERCGRRILQRRRGPLSLQRRVSPLHFLFQSLQVRESAREDEGGRPFPHCKAWDSHSQGKGKAIACIGFSLANVSVRFSRVWASSDSSPEGGVEVVQGEARDRAITTEQMQQRALGKKPPPPPPWKSHSSQGTCTRSDTQGRTPLSRTAEEGGR